jgi:hypothetical protein
MAKQKMTISVDSDIKREFAGQTALNGSKMSEVLEGMMERYAKASKKLRDERKENEI